jgi:hypothetical protein
MPIRYRQPVFMIGREPLVAGAIVVRNYERARRRHARHLRWNALAARLGLSRSPARKIER